MKTIMNYTFKGLNVVITVLIVLTIIMEVSEVYSVSSDESVYVKTDSIIFIGNEPKARKQEEVIKEVKVEIPKVNGTNKYKDTSYYQVIKTYHGNLSYYGPDCVGCSGKTATGYDVRGGNIYYNDKEFGKVRIVAGDKSIPFGSIVRFSIKGIPTLAIVLDRGGAIGVSKKFLFDILCEDEKTSYKIGIIKDADVDVLRLGY